MTDQPSQTPRNWRKAVDNAPLELEPFYSQWVSDLTQYALHSKADIATALAILSMELSAARRDAERYRWLREQRHADIAACWILPSKDYREVNSPEELDAAIDAAKGGK